MLNSLNEHHKNCLVDSKENDKFDLKYTVMVIQNGMIVTPKFYLFV